MSTGLLFRSKIRAIYSRKTVLDIAFLYFLQVVGKFIRIQCNSQSVLHFFFLKENITANCNSDVIPDMTVDMTVLLTLQGVSVTVRCHLYTFRKFSSVEDVSVIDMF